MDVDISTYRARIGRFLPKKYLYNLNVQTKPTKPAKVSKPYYLSTCLYLVLFISMISSLESSKYRKNSFSENVPTPCSALTGSEFERHYYGWNVYGNVKNNYLYIEGFGKPEKIKKYEFSPFGWHNPLKVILLSNPNFYAKYTYGNRNRGIKLVHWNAGSAHLENKMLELEKVVEDFHPHVFGISEGNLMMSVKCKLKIMN